MKEGEENQENQISKRAIKKQKKEEQKRMNKTEWKQRKKVIIHSSLSIGKEIEEERGRLKEWNRKTT